LDAQVSGGRRWNQGCRLKRIAMCWKQELLVLLQNTSRIPSVAVIGVEARLSLSVKRAVLILKGFW
jgi:hypothetical protein